MTTRTNPKSSLMLLLVAATLLLLAAPAARSAQLAPTPGEDDRSESPRFIVRGTTGTERLPLRATHVDAHVAGVIADVRVRQEYRNDGSVPIEAVYVFPASTRAAVNGLTMTIGSRVIRAQIKEKGAAREAYETARANGQSASLLEQQRPNVFQMNVANIMPGDVIEVELQYTELLVATEGVYEFVYPTVVGPRYVSPNEAGRTSAAAWNGAPRLPEGQLPQNTLDIAVQIAAGLPLSDVASPSHRVGVAFAASSDATVRLAPEERQGGNRDFVLHYRLAGARVAPGLLLYQGKDENFFLLMVQPPRRVVPEQLPPREYVFIVDVSGSMNGFPIEVSKTLLRDLISALRPQDRFNVLLFAGGSRVLSDTSLPGTPENLDRALRAINGENGGGGTELLPALRRALALPRTEGFSRSVVIATDGFVSVENEAFDVVRRNLGAANVFAFGIGTSVNRNLIEKLARAGQGEAFVVADPTAAPAAAERFRRYVSSPVLAGVHVDFGAFAVQDVAPAAIPDLFAERPLVVFGKWTGAPTGEIVVRGRGAQPFEARVPVGSVRARETNAALRELWARTRIATLSDEAGIGNKDAALEITRLGLAYSLLTEYTSFVAVDSLVRNTTGSSATVDQPVPLPQGVNEMALQGQAVAKLQSLGYVAGGVAQRAMAPATNMAAPPPPHPAAPGRAKGERAEERIDSVARPTEHKDDTSPADRLRGADSREQDKKRPASATRPASTSQPAPACLASLFAGQSFAPPAGTTITLTVSSTEEGDRVLLTNAGALDPAARRALEAALKSHAATLRACLGIRTGGLSTVHVTFGAHGTITGYRVE